jgi:3-methyladenine DNA glycosylase/8-oxoguanine DNA glycosylase
VAQLAAHLLCKQGVGGSSPPVSTPDASSTWCPDFPTDVALTLARLRRGHADPTHQESPDGAVWRTTLTVNGPATVRFTQDGLHTITGMAWGPGAATALDAAPMMVGALDNPTGFTPGHPLLRDANRRWPGLRIPRTGRVMEALVPAVLEQRVIGLQAMSAWRRLVYAQGTKAPGPTPSPMMVVPSVRAWQLIPSWQWHAVGVDPRRSRTVMACLAVARQLEAATSMTPIEAAERLRSVSGVGAWTAAEVAQRALGDSDALSVGDYHLAGMIGHTLFGVPFNDHQMVEAMAPWSPHRYRVVRLLEASGHTQKPRRGPRMSFENHRAR